MFTLGKLTISVPDGIREASQESEVAGILSGTDTTTLREIIGSVASRASELAADDAPTPTADTVAELRQMRQLATMVKEELTTRSEAASLAAELADTTAPEPPPAPAAAPVPSLPPEPAPDPAPTTAANQATEPPTAPDPAPAAAARSNRIPSVGDVAPAVPAQPPASSTPAVYAALQSATSVAGYTSGQQLTSFSQAAEILSRTVDQFASSVTGRTSHKGQEPIRVNGDGGKQHMMRAYERKPGVQIVRQYPAELTAGDGANGLDVAKHAASERRLPGGNLMESARRALRSDQRRSLTAASGWCAPSETIYALCELESMDGLLALPEIMASRGGINIPANGGPDFSTIWTGLGTTHRTEAQVIAETPPKTCYEIPCPDFEDVRLGVDYMCLTSSLLQRRGYPELVSRFGRGSMVALAHKINAGVIAAAVTAAGAANVLSECATGTDAAASLLSGVELAVMDCMYRNRMARNSTIEVVLPYWALTSIRTALAHRSGIAEFNVTDEMIFDWFAIRGAVIRLVYDWQDAYTTLPAGPGGAAAMLSLPTSVEFLVYPAGAFTLAVQDVVQLDTVYDSTLLSTNQYTAMFAEDGWALLQLCPYVRRYSAAVDPCSTIGCCLTSS